MSKYIIGKDRNQIEMLCLEERIDEDNEVRLIDLFVNSLPLADFGFKEEKASPLGGRPAYHPSTLLKLFIYGYMNRIRSSRQLEKECNRNLEVMWLMGELAPDHNTIANFRKDNPDAIKKVFRATVQLAQNLDLIGGKLLAGDGTVIRAQNSKKKNYNQKKIDRHLAYIENKLEEYNTILADEDGDVKKKEEVKDKIKKQLKHQEKYHKLQEQLEQTQEGQISTSDPDSKKLLIRNKIFEVAYNVQSTVDSKFNIPINYQVTNQVDRNEMGNILKEAVEILDSKDFTALFDKGYHTGSEFEVAEELEVEVLVAIPKLPSSSMAPNPAYNASEFVYNDEEDTYTCPEGNILRSNGKLYVKRKGGKMKKSIKVKNYRTDGCKTCPVYDLCTRVKGRKGRVIERATFAHLVENNRQRMEEYYELYQKRQAIVEHPFGTIKRQWGFDHIMTKKTMKRASADVGLVFTAYNLRRIFNILSQNKFERQLRALTLILSSYKSEFKPFIESLIFLLSKLNLRKTLINVA